jgi:FkbM family methyltransferase
MATPPSLCPGSRYTLVADNPHYPEICVFDQADGISKAIINKIEWESEVCNALANLYVPDTDVIDVGANLGLNALGMHRRKPVTGGMIHMFEPQHDVFSALRFNARHLPAKLYNIAITDAVRVLRFEQLYGNVGGTPLQGVGGALNSPFVVPLSDAATHVLGINLDALAFTRRVSVMKIDAEGGELGVLIGAQRLIKEHRPSIVIEVWPQNRGHVFGFLQQMGYVMRENIKDTFGDDFIWTPADAALDGVVAVPP